MIRLAINGASGRVGRRLIALAHDDSQLKIVSATCSQRSASLGADAGELAGIGSIGLALTAQLENHPHAVIDFSSPTGTRAALEYCSERSVPIVVATTGLAQVFEEELLAASHKIPVCHAPNMSLAVNLTMILAKLAASALRTHATGVDVEIIERHHRYKADAPSGTALKFGKIISAAMGQQEHRHGRQGATGARPATEIGFHAVRAGDDPGQHTIVFGMLGETIELRVAATSRDCYAHGAIAAAKYLVDRGPGMYSMADVLGIAG